MPALHAHVIVERTLGGDNGDRVTSFAAMVVVVCVLLVAAVAAITGSLSSLFTKTHTFSTLKCTDLRQNLDGATVAHELYGHLHEVVRQQLGSSPMQQRLWAAHCVDPKKNGTIDMGKVSMIAEKVFARVCTLQGVIGDEGLLKIVLEGKNPAKQVRHARDAAAKAVVAKKKDLDACRPRFSADMRGQTYPPVWQDKIRR